MKKIFILFISILLFSCKNEDSEKISKSCIICPSEISERAFKFAELYKDSETEYKYGSQDSLRAIKIDCSGLVVMCYKYALVDTEYSLFLPDMSSAWIYENASEKTEHPTKGDLVFMGEEDSQYISHIALFEKKENGNVYFIDSTEKDSDNDGIIDINGVTKRFYPENDKKIKSLVRWF